jgi:hypothetical protein
VSSPGSSGKNFEVHLSAAMAKKLRTIHKQAMKRGKGEAVVEAFRRIVQRLESDPLEFGEPLHRLPALRMRIRHGAILPLSIHFAVAEDHALVFLKGISLLPDRQE